VFYANARQNWFCGALDSFFGLKTGLELCVCKAPAVGANPIQD